MHSHRAQLHSSRRAPPLADHDIDHEISLVDHDAPTNPRRSRSLSVGSDQSSQSAVPSTSHQPLTPSDSQVRLTQPASEDGQPEPGASGIPRIEEHPGQAVESPKTPPESSSATQVGSPPKTVKRPSVNGQGPQDRPVTPKEPETEIDILYENQRGGFLCGIPLFSSAALGNLDPPAWTNFAHKPSPTDIHTAQVPDPTWQWVWPEWRVNHDEQIETDGDGWEYSFMFSKKFSWHPPKWYNSFVRRRAWIRRRIKFHPGSQGMEQYGINQPYFTVMPKRHETNPFAAASEMERASTDGQSRQSRGESRVSRDRSGGALPVLTLPSEIHTIHELMIILSQSRIDREKLEAIENYIQGCTDDLQHLQYHMHHIMSIFVFQTSRKTLLARLTQLHDDDLTARAGKGKSAETTLKARNLAAAIEHADGEVRKLEYWSDIKGMTEEGEAVGAVDDEEGWDSGWQGLDKSGPMGVDEGDSLPGTTS